MVPVDQLPVPKILTVLQFGRPNMTRSTDISSKKKKSALAYSLARREPTAIIRQATAMAKDTSAVAVEEQQIRRHRHAAAVRSPLQALGTNCAGDSASKEVYITPKSACANADASARTPKRASTTKRPSSNSHGASFFSPPRALREPIPFLSPTAPNYKDFAGTEDVRVLRNPRLTLKYFLQGVAECALRHIRWPSVLTRNVTGSIVVVLAGLWGLLHATCGGQFDSYFIVAQDNDQDMYLPSQYASWLVSATTEAFFWIGCGILSTAGLGSGVQTGALILFPHCVGLAVEWVDSHDSASSTDATSAFADLMWSVGIAGFWSGTGSAVGELLPYVLAKMIKAAGGDPFALLEEPDIPDPRSLEFDESGQSTKKKKSLMSVLVANTRSAMEGQLLESKWRAFLKLFILAAVPNGLFDLCGLVCGASGVSFWLFFGAVWSGKALVRTPLQTCGLAAAVAYCSNSALVDDSAADMDRNGTSISAMTLNLAKDVVSAIVHGDERTIDDATTTADGVGQASMSGLLVLGIKGAWTCATFSLLGFFFLSTIEQVAQHHAKQQKGK